MKRVAVLGGTGFVGRNLCEVLAAHGVEHRAFSRLTGCDLLDLETAWSKLSAYQPDYLVNCAAVVGSVNYVRDFGADVIDVNTRMLLNLYKIAQQMRTATVINPVANCAYPGVLDLYDERRFWDGPIHPTVLSYGTTRRMMLALSRCYADQYGIRSVNLGVPNIYGPFDSTNPNKTHALNALVMKFVRAKRQGEPVVEIWGTGKPVREWLYVRDFGEVVYLVISGGGTTAAELTNIGQKKGYSVDEIADLIRGAIGYEGRLEHNTAYPDGSPQKVMDDALFRQTWPAFRFTPIAEGIAETARYYERIL